MKADHKVSSKDSTLSPDQPERHDQTENNRLGNETVVSENTDRDTSIRRSSLVTKRRGEEVVSSGNYRPQASQFDACQWERVFNTVTSGMRIVGLDHRTLYVNDAFCRLTGVSKAKAIAQPCHETFAGEACHTQHCPLNRIADGEQQVEYDVQEALRDGSHKTCAVSASPLKDTDGSLIGIIEDVRDVTDRRQAAEALRDSEEHFRRIFETSHTAIVIGRIPDGEIVDCNQSCERIFGYKREEIIGKTTVELNLWNEPSDREHIISELRSTGLIKKTGLKLRRKSRETAVVDSSFSIVRINGQDHTLAIVSDVTERYLAESELKCANNELEIERTLLRNKNVALRELMEQIDQQKQQTNHQLQTNVNRIVRPMLDIINQRLGSEDQHLMELLDSALSDLLDPTVSHLEQSHANLSPRETEVCNMIRRGFSSKQMASILSVSVHTINNQRRSIRKKLDISDNRTNLETYLKSL